MLTRRGLGVLVAGIVLAICGALLGWPELSIIGVAMALAVGLALLFLLVRPRVDVVREIEPDRVTAGGLAYGRVKVFNAGRRESYGFVARERFGDGVVEVPIPRLKPGRRKSTLYRLPAARRGVVPVGPMLIGRADPLGLVRSEREHGEVITLWVHPRHHALTPLPSMLTRSLEGPTSDTAPNGSITFHAIREYVVGDDLRQIHWRSSAKTGTLMVRQHVDTSLPDVTLVVDTRDTAHTEESFETAMEVVASLTLASTTRSFPIQLHTTGGLELSSRGPGNASQEFLDQLAALTPEPATPERGNAPRRGDGDAPEAIAGHSTSLTGLLNLLARARGGSGLVVVAAAPTAEETAAVAAMTRRYGIVTLVDCRPDPTHPIPAVHGVTTIGAPTGAAFAAEWNRRHR
jgi:uncharacterized protein (DUF58 family)